MGSLRLLAVVLMALPATAALAQPKPPTPQQLQQAGDLVKKAIARSQAGDHLLAIELYQQAFNIAPAPILLSNIGAEYQQLGKAVDALRYFCKYLEADPAGSNATYATAQAKSLQIQLGNPMTEVDDKDVCKPPKPVVKPVVVDEGVGSGNRVTGAQFGSSGSGPGSASTDPVPNKGLEYAGLGIGVVGLIGVGLGIDFAFKAKSLNDQINSHNPTTAWPSTIDGVAIKDWDSQGKSWNTDTYVFTIVGGVAVIAGGAMFLIGHKGSSSEHAEHTAIVPTANQHGGGVSVLGRF